MYSKFNSCIVDFSQENEPGDYWYDCAILESTEILKQFSDDDWELLLKELKSKSIFWQKRLIECLGDLNNTYELKVLLELINTDNEDLYIACIDSLRSLDISILNPNFKSQLLAQLKVLIEKATPPVKSVLKDFMEMASH